MPYGYAPIPTSFTSITTSSSDCSGEGLPGTDSAARTRDNRSSHSIVQCDISPASD
jgi:hypothetical protein